MNRLDSLNNLSLNRTTGLNPQKGGTPDEQQLHELCNQFEAILIQNLFKNMRRTVPEGGLVDQGFGKQMFQDLLDQSTALQMSRQQGIGIADTLFRQLALGQQPPGTK